MKLKVNIYYQYSDLDKQHQFGITFDNDENYAVYIRWIYFHLGRRLSDSRDYSLYPYAVGEKIKTYEYCNDAERQAKYIINRMIKILRK